MSKLNKPILDRSGNGKIFAEVPSINEQIERGGGVLFIDRKSDSERIHRLYELCCACGRSEDFMVLNPGDPAGSNTYSPILYGDPYDIAGRLIPLVGSSDENAVTDHYKQTIYHGLLAIVSTLKKLGLPYNFQVLSEILLNSEAIESLHEQLREKTPDSHEEKILALFLNLYRNPLNGQIDVKLLQDALIGIAGRIFNFGSGSYKRILNSYDPDIKLNEAIRDGKIVYVALQVAGQDAIANNFGEMLFGDLRSAVSSLQYFKSDRPKVPYMVFFDGTTNCRPKCWDVLTEEAWHVGVFLITDISWVQNTKPVNREVGYKKPTAFDSVTRSIEKRRERRDKIEAKRQMKAEQEAEVQRQIESAQDALDRQKMALSGEYEPQPKEAGEGFSKIPYILAGMFFAALVLRGLYGYLNGVSPDKW